MSTSTIAAPLARPTSAPSSSPGPSSTGGLREERELDAAVEGFEKLMVQRLLQNARRSSLGEEPSNAQANHDAMYDEAIAGVIAERGALGLADALRRSLDANGSLTVAQPPGAPNAARSMPGTDTAGPLGLDAASLATLRGMLADEPRDAGVADDALPIDPPGDAALAMLAAPERLAAAQASDDDGDWRRSFIERLRPHAERSAARLGTSSEVVLTIAAHESGWGRQPITDAAGRDAHNLFGIKSHGHDGPSVSQTTTEFIGGQARRVVAEFRRYDDPGASVDDFADFLIENPRYGDALAVAADPERFFDALQAAGYATDPDYAMKARSVLEQVRAHAAQEPGR